jgi:hypothetical protein
MADQSLSHPPRVLAGMAVGAVFGMIYFVCLSGMLYYTEMRDRQNDSLAFDLQAARHERARMRGLINEIDQDNTDLRALLGRSSIPQPYPASMDPTHDPRDDGRH